MPESWEIPPPPEAWPEQAIELIRQNPGGPPAKFVGIQGQINVEPEAGMFRVEILDDEGVFILEPRFYEEELARLAGEMFVQGVFHGISQAITMLRRVGALDPSLRATEASTAGPWREVGHAEGD